MDASQHDQPTAQELIDSSHPDSFLRRRADNGALFLAALQANLDAAGDLFQADTGWLGRVRSTGDGNALPALSELWLAAHFRRRGWTVRRIPEAHTKTADFEITAPALGGSVVLIVEVKRRLQPEGQPESQGLDVLDRRLGVGLLGACESLDDITVPSTLRESCGFGKLLSWARSRAEGQLQGVADPQIRAIAVDITTSKTYQRLIHHDPGTSDDTIRQLNLGRDYAILAYAVSFDHQELWLERWIVPPEAVKG